MAVGPDGVRWTRPPLSYRTQGPDSASDLLGLRPLSDHHQAASTLPARRGGPAANRLPARAGGDHFAGRQSRHDKTFNRAGRDAPNDLTVELRALAQMERLEDLVAIAPLRLPVGDGRSHRPSVSVKTLAGQRRALGHRRSRPMCDCVGAERGLHLDEQLGSTMPGCAQDSWSPCEDLSQINRLRSRCVGREIRRERSHRTGAFLIGDGISTRVA